MPFAPFDLEEDYVLISDEEFKIAREKNTNKAFFAERIAIRGELNFGLCYKDQYKEISLSQQGINTPIIIDSIVAMSGQNTADEIIFELWKEDPELGQIRVGIQRYSNNQMPTDFPDGIIYPDMTIKVKPVRNNATVVVYCKPVIVAFQAIATQQLTQLDPPAVG